MGSYILMVILICFSAFFSGSEISYASANQTRLKKAAENGGLAAKTAYYISTHFNRGLTMVLIGLMLIYDGVTDMLIVSRVHRAEKNVLDADILREEDVED